MRTHDRPTAYTAFLAIAAVCVFHIARPVAVSAQSSATARVEAVVLPVEAAWAAHRAVERVAHWEAEDAPTVYQDESGIVAWRDESSTEPALRVVTVAHLGS